MGSDSKKAFGAEGRGELLLFDPNKLVIVTDKKHPLYDERVELPIDEGMVRNIMVYGVVEPIVVRKNGEQDDGTPIVEVVDGRQRVKNAREANRRLEEEGKEAIRVSAVQKRGDNAGLFGVMISANEIRQDDTPMTRARKLGRYLAMGRTEEEAAITFGCSGTTIKNYLLLLDAGEVVQKALEKGQISMVAAKKLAVLPEAERETALAAVIEAGGGQASNDEAEKRRGGRRGRTRERKVKTRAQVIEFRESLSESTSDAAKAAAAVLGWFLGDEEALNGFSVLRKRAENVSDAE